MDIKEIALKVAEEMPSGFLWNEGCGYEAGILIEEAVDFAEALIAELAKQNKPVAWWNGKETAFFEHETDGPVGEVKIPLYTFPSTAEQIANETAEAIAKMLESGSFLSTESKVALAANGAAKAIRSGAWKEFKKS